MGVLNNVGRLDLHTFIRSYDTEVDTTDTNSGNMLRKVLYNPSSYGPTTVTTELLDVAPGASSIPTGVTTYSYASLPYGPLLVSSEEDQDYNGAVLKNVSKVYQATSGLGGWPEVMSSQTISDSHGTWKTTYGYDAQTPSPSGATQHQTGHNFGNLTSVTKWDGAVSYPTTLLRDDAGNITQVINPKGNPTYASYADSFETSPMCPPAAGSGIAAAYPSVVTNAKGQQTSYVFYSCSGLVKQVTDANHQPTFMTYDTLGRNLTTSYPDGGSTTNTYTDPAPSSMTTSVALGGGQTYFTQKSYDGIGREIFSQVGTSSDPNSVTKNTQYSDSENLVWIGVAGVNNYQVGSTEEDYYDVLGRQIEQDDSLGQEYFTSYSANMVDSADVLGNHTQRTSDALGHLQSVLEPDATTGQLSYLTSYQYDAMGNLWQVDQWGGPSGSAGDRQRTFVYNGLSQLTSSFNPEAGTIAYSYDLAGNLQKKTDANHVILYCYDELNRLVSKSIIDTSCPTNAASPNPYATLAYDGSGTTGNTVGRLWMETGIGSNANTRVYSYDPMGRTQSIQDSFTSDGLGWRTTGFLYDLAGDPTMIAYPSGLVVNQTWNNYRELTSISSNPATTSYMSNPTYDVMGYVTSETYGTTISKAIAYNPLHQVDNIYAHSSSGGLMALDFCYNGEDYSDACGEDTGNNGNVTQIVGSGTGTKNFTYDHLNRLTSFQEGSSPIVNYALDPWGNMSTVAMNSYQASFNSKNRIANLQCVGPGGAQYDGAGNQYCDGNPAYQGSEHEYTYNPDNQITQVSDSGFNSLASYTLSAEGGRVRKDMPDGSWKEYFISGGATKSEFSSTNGWTDYIYEGGQKIARNSGGSTYYYLNDPLGTAQAEVNTDGSLVWRGDFDPWGQELDNNPPADDYKFTGKERDSESGLDNFGARYYSSSMGRFMSPDWSVTPMPVPFAYIGNPQSLNLYQYTKNNPLLAVDADGHSPDCGARKEAHCSVNPDFDFMESMSDTGVAENSDSSPGDQSMGPDPTGDGSGAGSDGSTFNPLTPPDNKYIGANKWLEAVQDFVYSSIPFLKSSVDAHYDKQYLAQLKELAQSSANNYDPTCGTDACQRANEAAVNNLAFVRVEMAKRGFPMASNLVKLISGIVPEPTNPVDKVIGAGLAGTTSTLEKVTK